MAELELGKKEIHETEREIKGSAERIMIQVVGKDIASQMFGRQGTTNQNQKKIKRQHNSLNF